MKTEDSRVLRTDWKVAAPDRIFVPWQTNYDHLAEEEILSKDIVCFSHLRWDFVFQRPQHLLSRFAKKQRVFFIEEPFYEDFGEPRLRISNPRGGVTVVVPILRKGIEERFEIAALKRLMCRFAQQRLSGSVITWYYTPMALRHSGDIPSGLAVYDCMDELSYFEGAHPELKTYEKRMFEVADIVFTGGYSLYKEKRKYHGNIFPMPSSIDREHFEAARQPLPDPSDQRHIPRPRIGYFGVIDERLDRRLLRQIAEARPDWNYIILGPVVKINHNSLPQLPNIHYLGGRSYRDLPQHLANWDVAMMPFALNNSTKFISPTKTPEYLAGGKPVVSTPIADVIEPYGAAGLVKIASGCDQFIEAIQLAMLQKDDPQWHHDVRSFIMNGSWTETWNSMRKIICQTYKRKLRLQHERLEGLDYQAN